MRPLILIATAAISTTALAADAHLFVKLGPERPHGVSYVDVASVRRSGDALSVDILDAGRPRGQPATARAVTWRISCDWETSGGMQGAKTYDAQGRVTHSEGPEPFTQASFYGPHGWHVRLAPLACDPAWRPGGEGHASVAAAIAAVPPPPPPPPARAQGAPLMVMEAAPVTVPEWARNDGRRFGLVRMEPATGNVLLLDYASLVREGDTVTAVAFFILGDDTPPPPEPQWRFSVMKLTRYVIDCQAKTLTPTDYVSFGKSLRAESVDDTDWPARRASDWPLGAELLTLACAGVAPEVTLSTRTAAVAFQRRLHPLRTNPPAPAT